MCIVEFRRKLQDISSSNEFGFLLAVLVSAKRKRDGSAAEIYVKVFIFHDFLMEMVVTLSRSIRLQLYPI